MTEDARPGASDHKPLEHKPSITLRSPGSPALYGLSRSRSPATFSNGSPRDATHATPVGALHKAVSLQSLMALSGVRSATPPYSPYSFTFSPPSRRQAYIEEAMSLASPTDPQLDPQAYTKTKQSEPHDTGHRFVIQPHSTFRTSWDMLLALLIFYNAVAVPFRLGFEVSGGLGIFVFDSVTDFLFLVDIVLNFRTVVEVAGMVLTKPKDIGKYYLRTWFGLDLVSSFPVDVILLFAGAEPGDSETLRVNRMLKVLKCFRLLRVFRLARLSRIMHNARTLLSIKHSFRWIGKYSLCVLLAAHYISCGWFLVANVEEDGGEEHVSWVTQFHMAGADEPGTLSNASLKTKYIVSLSHSILVMSSIGSSIEPVSDTERIYHLITMICGTSLWAFGMLSLSDALFSLHRNETLYKQKMDFVSDFLARRLPHKKKLRRRVRLFYEHLHQRQRYWGNECEIISDLSRDLQTEVLHALHDSMISKNVFFTNLSRPAVSSLIQCLTLFSFNPNEIIVNEGEVGTEMFFIADGIVEVYLASKVLRRMKDGDYFGEIALMSELAIRTASVRAISFCDIFCLTKAAVDEVLSRYPEDKEKWKKICSRRIFVHSPSKKKSRTTYDRGVDPVSGGSDSKSWKSFLQSMSSFGRSSRSSSRRKFEKDFTSIVTAEAEARDKEEGSQGTPRSATGEPGVSEEMGAMEDAVLGREDSTGILKNLLAELQMEKELRMKKEEELRVVEAKISKFCFEVHRGAM